MSHHAYWPLPLCDPNYASRCSGVELYTCKESHWFNSIHTNVKVCTSTYICSTEVRLYAIRALQILWGHGWAARQACRQRPVGNQWWLQWALAHWPMGHYARPQRRDFEQGIMTRDTKTAWLLEESKSHTKAYNGWSHPPPEGSWDFPVDLWLFHRVGGQYSSMAAKTLALEGRVWPHRPVESTLCSSYSIVCERPWTGPQ